MKRLQLTNYWLLEERALRRDVPLTMVPLDTLICIIT